MGMRNSRFAMVGALALVTGTGLMACTATATRKTAGRAIDDATITARIKAALIANPETKAHQIDVTTYRGVVQLAGFVDSDHARDTAMRMARQESGVSKVDDALHVMQRGGGVARVADDTKISAKVNAALIANPITKARQIEVTTLHGEVLLSGFVDSNEERDTATKVAQSVEGVTKVDNELQLKPPPTRAEGNSSD